jgi:LPXTG-motif cell wall-anchored protein
MRVAGGAAASLGLATVLGAVLAAPAAAEDSTPGAAPAASSDICIIGVLGHCPPTISLPPSEPPTSAPPPPPPTTQAPPPTQINQPAPSNTNQLIANGTATPTQAGPTLPATGSDLGLIAGVGAALAGTGGVLLVASRRRAVAPLKVVDVTGTSDDE